ncbi:hypothetical protein NMD99_02565 [Wolbachia endosymbiont of Listronotus oregonensis]|uniref:hypothetical protein n=1 Tax=Wolbachia endosymbiont of Listronotus oregonensis TaxID=2969106 RepID=UPI0028156059|nr:hypothetical protein [Wolbachia endosymbiont of Listronotus oregonensis]WMT84884.1 hypothetical protein NMD99_02565 [Wolbachia endosymbiont of Listronotus oregonensis]
MGKYTNAWFYKKDNHDCANDGTCGQSITDFRIGDSKISFHDNHGRTIAQIPKLPHGNSFTYYNNLYKTAQSRNFGENTKYVGVQDVLPNQFNFEYGKLNCVIHYDNVSQQEQEQMKLDIKNAYEAYKAKFCIASNIQVTVHTYIFNNGDDYRRYGTLVPGFSRSQSSLNISGGMTNGESVLLYKDAYTDNVLAHEFGHVFQFKLSEAKVEELDRINNQLMANAIGLEVEEKNYKAICKQMGVDEYKDHGSMFQFKYKDTTGSIYRKDLSEEEKFQIIQRVKNSGLDEYEDRGSMFQFKYKGTLYKYHKNLSEEEKFKAIQSVKNIHELVDEYKDHGSMFSFKYKGTTGSIYRKDLSEEEKFQIIQRVKNSGLDEYEDRGSMFQFKYKDTTGSIYRKDLSEEEKFQIIQRVKNSGLDEYEDRGSMFQFKYKGTLYKYHKNLSEEEKFKAIQNVKNIHELVDEYKDHGSMFSFKYKGTTYNVKCEYFSEKEKLQFIKDIKNSHESLISECDGLNEGPLSQNATVVISIDENKEISRMYFHNPDKNMSEWLDKTLISRSKSEEDVDDTDPKPGKEPEPESGKESKEDISRSKPEQEVEKSNEVEQSNVDVEEEKSNQQDTQQPSNFLGSVK